MGATQCPPTNPTIGADRGCISSEQAVPLPPLLPVYTWGTISRSKSDFDSNVYDDSSKIQQKILINELL